jgi:hypothetical protein
MAVWLGGKTADAGLRNDDEGESPVFQDVLQPDIVVEEAVMQRLAVEIFGGRGAAREGTERDAVAFLSLG